MDIRASLRDDRGSVAAPQVTSIEWMDPPLLPIGAPVPAELVAQVKQRYGEVPEHFRRLSHCPWVQAVFAGPDVPNAFLPYELSDLIWLVVSQDNSCRHCYGASRAVLRMLGYSEKRILSLETDLHAVDIDPKTRLALDYARRISRSNPRPGPTEERLLLDAGFSPQAIAELAVHASLNVFGNRVMTLCAMEPASIEKLPERWYAPLLRPVFQWSARRRKLAPPRYFEPGENVGLGASLFAALDGVPTAIAGRQLLTAAFQSPILPLRAKILAFAVVARTLGCSAFEREMLGQLRGMDLEPRDVREILDNLSSPKLSPLEAQLIPAARETVRYQKPKQIQGRMRELAARMTPAEFLETVGTFALANMLGRLTVLLDRCA